MLGCMPICLISQRLHQGAHGPDNVAAFLQQVELQVIRGLIVAGAARSQLGAGVADPFDEDALDEGVDVFVPRIRRQAADRARDADGLEGCSDLPVFHVGEQPCRTQGSGMGDAAFDVLRNQARMGDSGT